MRYDINNEISHDRSIDLASRLSRLGWDMAISHGSQWLSESDQSGNRIYMFSRMCL